MENEQNVSHNAFVYNRKRLELSGISDVVSFSDSSVEADYSEGLVVVEGEDMKIEDFSGESGKLVIVGTINGFYYFGKTKKEPKSLFGRSRR